MSIHVKGLFNSTCPILGLLAIALVGEALSIQWSPHGGGASLVLFLLASVVIVVVVEAFLVPVSAFRLVKSPSLRTFRNIAAVSFGTAYIIGASIWMVSQLQELWV